MKFNKRKFNLILCFVMALICVTVAFSSVAIENPLNRINAENESEDNSSDIIEEDKITQNGGSEGSNASQESNKVESGDDETTVSIDKAPKFKNVWEAYYYALEKDEVISSYQTYEQTVHAEANGYPVTVDFKTTRKIYDQITNISVINSVCTNIDIGNLGVNITDGKTFTSYCNFDVANQTVHEAHHYERSIESAKQDYVMLTYEVPPYIINEKTATASMANAPKKNYYELTFVLKSSAWQNYRYTLQNSIGDNCTQLPTINSITIKVKIDKTYGTFMSFEMTENFEAVYTYGSLDVSLDCVSKVSLKYSYNDSRIATGDKEVKSRLPYFQNN